jgi:penicillin-binding protein 1A
VHAEYVAETVRQLMFAQYGNETYTRGLNVYTTVKATDQDAAYKALRRGIMDYERRQIYRGPEKFITTCRRPRSGRRDRRRTGEHPDNGDVMSAVVLEADPKKIPPCARTAKRWRSPAMACARPSRACQRQGASPTSDPAWRGDPGRQDPQGHLGDHPVAGGRRRLCGAGPAHGAIRALVGGFDFDKNKFNHVTQAWRQPGSSFKPFIYSAALEKGFTPSTMVNDAPLFFDAGVTGGQPWEPKNYDGKFEGPMTLRTALAKRSKNMVSIRILQAVGPRTRRNGSPASASTPTSTRLPDHGAGRRLGHAHADGHGLFGVCQRRLPRQPLDHHPRHRPERQGPGGKPGRAAGPSPTRDRRAQCLRHEQPAAGSDPLGHRRTRAGHAQAPDLYGKTGTTNDAMDAWFAGYQPTLAAVVWIGYDTPRKMGSTAKPAAA